MSTLTPAWPPVRHPTAQSSPRSEPLSPHFQDGSSLWRAHSARGPPALPPHSASVTTPAPPSTLLPQSSSRCPPDGPRPLRLQSFLSREWPYPSSSRDFYSLSRTLMVGVPWVAQSVERPTLGLGSGHDPRVVGPSPTSGSTLSGAQNSLSPSALPPLTYVHVCTLFSLSETKF